MLVKGQAYLDALEAEFAAIANQCFAGYKAALIMRRQVIVQVQASLDWLSAVATVDVIPLAGLLSSFTVLANQRFQ